jgi:hypothetical protein
MRWLWAAFLTLTWLVSAQAFTCEDVRGLSLEKRAYYIKVLSITPGQQERIRRECLTPNPQVATSRSGNRERGARAEQ